MILIEPADAGSPTISTPHILATIDKYASSTALILLPGIQYYTGQYLDIESITAHAHSHGIMIGWDLAHAVGNVEVYLHDWGVDFAAWCNYKYVNSGPGAIAGLFVHEKHGQVDMSATTDGKTGFRPRLSGWWGADKIARFEMDNRKFPSFSINFMKRIPLTSACYPSYFQLLSHLRIHAHSRCRWLSSWQSLGFGSHGGSCISGSLRSNIHVRHSCQIYKLDQVSGGSFVEDIMEINPGQSQPTLQDNNTF